MKKYLLGLFAIVLAIGFSSFTSAKKVKTTVTGTEYNYWYNVANDLVVDVYTTNETRESILMSTPPCHDDEGIICLVGSETELSVNQDVTQLSLDADAKIFED